MFNSYHVTAGTVQGVVGGVMVVASDACGDGDVDESGVVDSDVVVVVGGVFVDVARDAHSRSQQFFKDVRAARTLESALMSLFCGRQLPRVGASPGCRRPSPQLRRPS